MHDHILLHATTTTLFGWVHDTETSDHIQHWVTNTLQWEKLYR